MNTEPGKRINTKTYDWCVTAFSLVKDRLGLNLNTHVAPGALEQGQIFLFNHFARFETVIPQYILHQATGAYARCVATHELFANARFGDFLWSVGAVPNNHPGLLPFLAAEILRGRKVIIFPEGGMVKDRRVLAANGDYGLTAPSGGGERKHHKGAAALAVTLEVYKKRILTVHKRGETERLERWVKALGLETVGQLLDAARKPTFVVPGNITFYPIRTDDNILRRAFDWAGLEMGRQAQEELLIEGNILLKETDMDVRLGAPMAPVIDWTFLEKRLLNRSFERVRSLDGLFGLRPDSDRLMDRILGKALLRQTRLLRDQAIHAMYGLATINLSHLTSRLIFALIRRGERAVGVERFHRLLFAAIKNAQGDPRLNLHPSLDDPNEHENIHCHTCDCPAFERFLALAIESGLIERSGTAYVFLPELCARHDFHQVRLKNPIDVYANEAAPIEGVRQAVDDALQGESAIRGPRFSALLFDNELRAFSQSKKAFSKARYREINTLETATADGTPYLLSPEGAAERKGPYPLGIVLVHGFLASPAELRGFGNDLAALGLPVMGVRLKGHGTSPWDLQTSTRHEWLSSVRRGVEIMAGMAGQVALVGFSTGGALALKLAAESGGTVAGAAIAGIAAVAAPIRFVDKNFFFVPLIDGLNKVVHLAGVEGGVMPFKENASEHPDINYRHMPIRGLRELQHLVAELEADLAHVTCPTLILQADRDPVVAPESARIIYDGIDTEDRHFRAIHADRHGILNEDIGATRAEIIAFLGGLAQTAGADTLADTLADAPAAKNPPAKTREAV